MRRGAAVLLVALLGVGHLRGQEPSTIFYRARPYGSEAAFTPLAAIIASAYYDFQLNNRGDDPFALPYGAGARNLMANLTSPLAAIGEYGWGRFLTTEILPVPIPSHGQWVPNYIGHLIGEGMAYRYSLEWYRWHGVDHPKLLAILTSTAGAFVNEVVENGSYVGANVDPIADMYIFNPVALLLFSSDSAARFFHSAIELSYWPRLAALDVRSATLHSVGYHTVIRYHPGDRRLGIAFVYGVQALLGPSYRIDRERRVIIAVGAAADDLVEVEQFKPARALTATFGPGLGVFLDRNNSLLVSLLLTPSKEDRAVLNVYPGVVGPGWLSPGVSLRWRHAGGMGVSVEVAPLPIGVGTVLGGARGPPP